MEIWLPVVGYEGFYEVSNRGQVKTLAHYRPHSWHDSLCFYPDRILKHDLVRNYHQVKLSFGEKLKGFKVHRLVAQAFIPNPQDKPEINHIDGNKINNHVSNLEWVTSSENQKHAFRIGLQKSGLDNATCKVTKEDIYEIRRKLAEGVKSQEVIAIEHSISRGLVSRIKLGLSWKCY